MRTAMARTLFAVMVGSIALLAQPATAEAQIWCPACTLANGCSVVVGPGAQDCWNREMNGVEICYFWNDGYCTGEPVLGPDGTAIVPDDALHRQRELGLPLFASLNGEGLLDVEEAGDVRYERVCQEVIARRFYSALVAEEMRVSTAEIAL